jgi:hypothetical protein
MKTSYLGLAALVALSCGSAHALTTVRYKITASDFHYNDDGRGPVEAPPVTLQFSITFDASKTSTGPSSAGVDVSEFTLGLPVRYFYNATNDMLSVAGHPYLQGYYWDGGFGIVLFNAVSDHASGRFFYVASGGDVYEAYTNSVISKVGVPEPASWLLMLVGMGVLGAGMRSRRGQSIVGFDHGVAVA